MNHSVSPDGSGGDPGDAEVSLDRVLGDHTGRRDLPDVPAGKLGEPEVAVGADLDVPGKLLLREQRELGLVLRVRRIEPDDVVPDLLGEPDVAVRPGGDERRELADPARVLVDRAVRMDDGDLVDGLLREPEVAVREEP